MPKESLNAFPHKERPLQKEGKGKYHFGGSSRGAVLHKGATTAEHSGRAAELEKAGQQTIRTIRRRESKAMHGSFDEYHSDLLVLSSFWLVTSPLSNNDGGAR